MKKYILAITLLLFSTSLFSYEVDIDEIKSKKINFINFTGKESRSESVSEIKSIGYRLSYIVKDIKTDNLSRFNMKYSIIRAISKNEKEKFSADIIFIDKDARVDHIRNVRRIISAYLEGLYGYTEKEADTIAIYTTYYNALYRGNTDYFSSKYSSTVMKHITKANAGLSTLWSDWPGKTAIIIPLTEQNKRGEIGGIDPFVISDDKVKEEITKENDNKNIKNEMVNIKEKDIDRSRKNLDEDKKKLEERKKETEVEKKKVEDNKVKTEKKNEQIKKEKEDTAKIREPEKKKAKEEEIKKKEEDVKKEDKKISEDQKKVSEKENKNKKDEKEIIKKEEEIKKKEEDVKKEKTGKETPEKEKTAVETKDTGKDNTKEKPAEKTAVPDGNLKKKEEALKEKEKELDRREDKLKDKDVSKEVFGLKIYYLEVKEYLEGGHYNNVMYMINTTTKKIDFQSTVTTICGRRYDVFSGGIAVITHAGTHQAGHRLTLIDRETLKEIKTGGDNIFWRSFIEIKDNFIYAIIKDQESFYLGKFDTNLKLVAKSSEKINGDTFITFFEKSIYINRVDKTIIVLKMDDLKLSDVIKP